MDTHRSLRVRKLMMYFKMNISQFANKIGMDQSNLSSILNGRRPFGDGIVNKILVSFDNINKEWLLTGEGEMLKSTGNNSISAGGNIDIAGSNVSGSNVVTNNITLPEKGSVKIIKPDGGINIMPENLIEEAPERIKELETQLRECERDLIKAKDKIIELLERNNTNI